jgi:hypothetical protein
VGLDVVPKKTHQHDSRSLYDQQRQQQFGFQAVVNGQEADESEKYRAGEDVTAGKR